MLWSLSIKKWIVSISHNNRHVQIISEIHSVLYPDSILVVGSVFEIITSRASN